MQEVFKIKPNIWHIQDVEGVFFTVLAGEREALVVDSGYGKADHRAFVESLIHTPYLVANSHGHPDHVGGNSQYDTVYVHPADLDMAKKKGSHAADRPVLKPLQEETVYDLGGLHVRVTALPGHTKGTVGFLAEEYRLLITGDAFNPDMWMFAENHDTLDTLEQTLEKALTLPFDSYLGSHTTKEVPQNFLREALANVRERRVDWYSWEKILGRDTYEITHQGKYGRSSIRIDEEEALRIQATQERGFYTRLLHGNDDIHFADGATIPPVYQTSAFSHETAQEIADIFAKKQAGYNYSRIGNPTIRAFEERITALEGGAMSVAFASGMAAITASLMNVLSAGDAFISTTGLYGGTIELFKGIARFGITVKYVPVNDFDAMEKAITPEVKLIFAETISNPGLKVADIGKMSEIAHRYGIPLLIDNTMATDRLGSRYRPPLLIKVHQRQRRRNQRDCDGQRALCVGCGEISVAGSLSEKSGGTAGICRETPRRHALQLRRMPVPAECLPEHAGSGDTGTARGAGMLECAGTGALFQHDSRHLSQLSGAGGQRGLSDGA